MGGADPGLAAMKSQKGFRTKFMNGGNRNHPITAQAAMA